KTAHHMFDGAVLARRVESLEDQQHAERVLGGEPVLVCGEKVHALGKQRVGLWAGHWAGVAGIMVTAEPDRAPRRYQQRVDEVRHEAETSIHLLSIPSGRSLSKRPADRDRQRGCADGAGLGLFRLSVRNRTRGRTPRPPVSHTPTP